MKAIVHRRYGTPDVLELIDTEIPAIGDAQVLIRVRAAAVNPLDWHMLRGVPYVMRLESGLRAPKNGARGADVAGIVEAVGKDVTTLAVGDEVYGDCGGAFAEFTKASPKFLALKPPSLSFEEAAAVPVAAVTAIQGLRDAGQLQPGQSVLINGAAGGVGTFAVQIAKALGATVAGVCSTGNDELVRSLGADRVIDYTTEDFTRRPERYDVLFDLAGNRSLRACRRVLTPRGTLVLCSGGPPKASLLGPMRKILGAKLSAPFVRGRSPFFLAKTTTAELETITALIESGAVRPVIDRTYPLAATADALRYLEQGHARGKVVITV